MPRIINENEPNDLQEKLKEIKQEQYKINTRLKVIAYRDRKKRFRGILNEIDAFNAEYNVDFFDELNKVENKILPKISKKEE